MIFRNHHGAIYFKKTHKNKIIGGFTCNLSIMDNGLREVKLEGGGNEKSILTEKTKETLGSRWTLGVVSSRGGVVGW